MRLLEDPTLIQNELKRRLEAAKNADPLRHRFENLQREKSRLENKMERLVTAYQEGLLSLRSYAGESLTCGSSRKPMIQKSSLFKRHRLIKTDISH